MDSKRLGPSAVDIQNHLYASFLEGSTADVALRVHGSWDAIYMLHRVVLIQSGFFRSLFTAGFAESSPRTSSGNGADEIVIHFDDPNITRAAFEVCISRLYGGGPPLDISPFLIPSLSHPLTQSFPKAAPPHVISPDHHPATPRFLLSLLATAVYLSISSLASQALSSILSTIGPRTVLRYLNFSLGHPITSYDADASESEPEAAVGLESVARLIYPDQGALISATRNDSPTREHPTKESSVEHQTSRSSVISSESDYEAIEAAKQPSYHYGAISDKIGEACACWLARWGSDLLPYEESLAETSSRDESTTHFPPRRKRSKTLPSICTSSKDEILEKEENPSVPLIWSRGGLDAKWVNAIISADTFFVRGERARYEFACCVVELRRKAGILPIEEEQWALLFGHGIYYANMPIEDLIYISQNVSPTTKEPYVSLETLQAAHWTQSILRNHIMSRPASFASQTPSGSIPSPPPRDRELGITQTTADILVSSTGKKSVNDTHFYVPGNTALHIGDNGNGFPGMLDRQPLSMEQLFTPNPNFSPSPSSPTLKPTTTTENISPPTSENNFFGLTRSAHSTSSAIAFDMAGSSQWSPYPPCRFAVEFWDLESLKEKSRLYSHTIWYAGSLFNVYVQVVRKKGQVQLGIYLHRQSSIEPIPPSSAPAVFPTSPMRWLAFKNASHSRELSTPVTPLLAKSHYSPSIYPASRSSTPLPTGSLLTTATNCTPASSPVSTSSITLPATALPITPPQPYRDPRPSISAFFAISCASAIGSSQTRFTSSPDVFSVGQSWGWKSSTLRTEELIDVRAQRTDTSHDKIPDDKISLRATVVLGLI